MMETEKNVSMKSKRKRGAQPNNLNAFRHGFYSRLFRPLEGEDLEDMLNTGLEDEIAMLRVVTRRTFELANQGTDIDEAIKALGAMGLASIRLSRLLKAQQELGEGDEALSALSTALNDILKEWGRI